MTFPVIPLVVTSELQLAGVWTDVSQFVYPREPITITAGRSDEGQRVEPSRCSLTLNNRDGRFSARNPLSPHFGQLGRNTPIRVSVKGPEPYLNLDGSIDGFVSTPDAVALDIVGDLDIRAEVSVNGSTLNQVLIAKWDGATSQRSYALRILDGVLWLSWSVNGATPTANASWELPALPARAALRATLDVDNGAGGRTVRMYWAESIAGPWTQFSDDIIQTGITSIFASTTPLRVGSPDTSTTPDRVPFTGRGHRFEVRAGIDGTIVASPDFTVQTPGATSFVDGTGKTWTLNGSAEITDREIRFTGEVSAWPPRWDVSGKDVWTPIEAAGVLRRLGQGNKPLDSTLRRRVPSFNPVAYWPMEEDREATQAYSPVGGVRPLTVTGLDFAADDTLPGSSPLPRLAAGASLSGSVPAATDGEWQLEMVYNLETLPGSLTTFMELATSGTARTVRMQVATSNVRLQGLDSDDAEVFLVNVTAPDFTGVWNRLQIRASTSGSTITANVRWITIGGGGVSASDTFTGTAGHITQVSSPFGSGLVGMGLGHLAVFSEQTDDPFNSADQAFTGETAVARLGRLAAEEQRLTLSWIDGDTSIDPELVGPQRPAALRELLQDSADADGGILYENREALALVYRTRTSLYNQAAALTLRYATDGEVAPPLEPVEDDQRLRNDVTVTRTGGSSGRVVIDEGPLSVLAPEDGGVGIYDETVTLNVHADAQTRPIAGWRAHLGTWDDARYPSVHVMLHAAPHLINTVLRLRIGDKGVIRNPPAWLPPDDIEFLIHGYTEVLDLYAWDIFVNAAPAGPWEVGVRDDVARGRRDTAGSELAVAVTAAATSWSVATTKGPLWTTEAADFPFDAVFGGERVTVTAITGSSSPQPWTVVRSANGISKSHTAGTTGRLARPTVRAL